MKKVLFLSGTKGGTGRTTLLLNSAVLLAYLWRNSATYPVVVIDLTPNAGTASIILFGDPAAIEGRLTLSDFFSGKLMDPIAAFYLRKWTTERGDFQLVFSLLSQDIPISKRRLEYVLQIVETRLKPKALFIDTPPLSATSPVVGLVDYVVPVVTPDVSAVEATRSYLEVVGGKRLRPVLNMYIPEFAASVTHSAPWDVVVEKTLGERPHVVPHDKSLQAARQALEIEVLKLRPEESQAVRAIVEYARYLSTALS